MNPKAMYPASCNFVAICKLDIYRQPLTAILQVEVITGTRGDLWKIARLHAH